MCRLHKAAFAKPCQKSSYPNPYETLKQLTRTNSKVNAQTIADFVETLDVADDVKQRIRNITPHNYVGLKIK